MYKKLHPIDNHGSHDILLIHRGRQIHEMSNGPALYKLFLRALRPNTITC